MKATIVLHEGPPPTTLDVEIPAGLNEAQAQHYVATVANQMRGGTRDTGEFRKRYTAERVTSQSAARRRKQMEKKVRP
jgi:hypothetical protein